MCFGNQVEKTQTQSLPEWLQGAAQTSVGNATNILNQGFTPYTGQQVAGFSPQQQQSFGLGDNVAQSAAGNLPTGAAALADYTTAGPSSVRAGTIASRMSPYMNQYVQQSLAPQLQNLQQQFDTQNKSFDSTATGAGAFGDTGWGLGKTNLTQQQDTARTGVIGNAYNAAFNTAIGAGAQDVSNNLNAQTTNANLREAQLGREAAGANAIFGQNVQGTQLENALGGQQTAQQQAQLNAQLNEFMRQQYQDPQFRQQLLNSSIQAGRAGAPVTTTTSAPDNSGWGMLASLGGTALGAVVGGPVGASIGGSIGSAIGGGMGGGGATSLNTNQAGWNPNVPGGYNSGGQYYAEGGRPEPGRPAVVGEKGAEAFVPDQGTPSIIGKGGPQVVVPQKPGTVIPHHMLKAAMAKRDRSRVAAAPELARALGAAA